MRIETIDELTPHELAKAKQEVARLAFLKNPYIISPHEVVIDHDALYIINEYCEVSNRIDHWQSSRNSSYFLLSM